MKAWIIFLVFFFHFANSSVSSHIAFCFFVVFCFFFLFSLFSLHFHLFHYQTSQWHFLFFLLSLNNESWDPWRSASIFPVTINGILLKSGQSTYEIAQNPTSSNHLASSFRKKSSEDDFVRGQTKAEVHATSGGKPRVQVSTFKRFRTRRWYPFAAAARPPPGDKYS